MTITLTLTHTPELFLAVESSMTDYLQQGVTVCGAEDPAVIEVNDLLGETFPDLQGLHFVRVSERFVSAWRSDTYLEFSDSEITDEEYARYEALADED